MVLLTSAWLLSCMVFTDLCVVARLLDFADLADDFSFAAGAVLTLALALARRMG